MRIPIAKEGAPFIAIALFCVIVAWLLGLWWLEFILVPLAVFVVAFFRDPERDVPSDRDSIVSPADGRVIKVERMRDERLLKTEAMKISIFMNVFNVHVNRSPAAGRVLDIIYNPGKFFNASLDKASLLNEQNALIMQAANGKRYAFNQIAGLIARRIVCRVKQGVSLKKGERFGLIRFGSRVDVYLPTDCRVSVKVGDKVKAGSSILGYWNAR
ncbi:MAG: phosphatidylserine decarboxylase family protein [Deltaproteobacteria bacterium]|nr:phosphatidylserine decarboxylase family protein [Deltaproteobacteria bacterium]